MPLAIAFFMFVTLIVLITGVFFMMRGGKRNQSMSTKLMTLRVIMQACAVALLAVMAILGSVDS